MAPLNLSYFIQFYINIRCEDDEIKQLLYAEMYIVFKIESSALVFASFVGYP